MYAVNRAVVGAAAGAEGAGGDDDDGAGEAEYADGVLENRDDIGFGAGVVDVGVGCAGAGAGEAVLLDPKRPRISSIVD